MWHGGSLLRQSDHGQSVCQTNTPGSGSPYSPAVGLHQGQWRNPSLWPLVPLVSGVEARPWDPWDPYPVPMT